jgi:hypothetical protein
VNQLRQIFAPNCSPHLLEMQCRRNRLPFDKMYLDNIPLFAHPWSADTSINLYTYCQSNRVNPGDLFATMAWSEGGFGSTVFERTDEPMMIDEPDLPPVRMD